MPSASKWLKPNELREIGRARTHQNNEEGVDDYRKMLETKRIPESMLRKHEADDNYNAPAAERTAKQTMILENRLFPNVPLARYFIIPIWNTFAELFSGKRVATNLLKIVISFAVIAACVTVIFYFPPVLSVFIANTFLSFPSLLTLAGIATVALYVGNLVITWMENLAHKVHWNKYECTRLQERYFESRYGIEGATSQKIKAYLINKEDKKNYAQPAIQNMASNLLGKLRISDENALHDITVFFIEESKLLKRAKPEEHDQVNYKRWKKDTLWVSEIIQSLDKAHNLNPETRTLLKEYMGRKDIKKWMKRIDELVTRLDNLLKAGVRDPQAIQECDKELKNELEKIKIEEVIERPKYPSINILFNRYNKVVLKKKDCEKLHGQIVKLDQMVGIDKPAQLRVIDSTIKKRLGIH